MAHFYAYALPDLGLASIVGGSGHIAAGTCRLYVDLTDMQGKPLVGQRILFYEPVTAGIEGPSVEVETDANGHAEANFEVGRAIEVVFVGTSFARTIVVPDLPSAEIRSLASVGGFDKFSVVKRDPIPAIRRS